MGRRSPRRSDRPQPAARQARFILRSVSRLQAVLAVAAICVLTVIRIAATHRVFSPTYDEPLHVAAGHEFLAEHRYRTGTDNPPLARAVLAFPLRHARPTAIEGGERIGQIFESAGDYMAGVAKA